MRFARPLLSTLIVSGILSAAAGSAEGSIITKSISTVSDLNKYVAKAESDPNNAYVIKLAKATYKLTHTLAITKANLTIKGSTTGPGGYIIDGQNKYQIFSVKGPADVYFGVSLELDGVDLKHGLALNSPGGAIYADNADLVLNDCILESNRADLFGSGIYAFNSMLEVTQCLFRSNWNTQSTPEGDFYLCGGQTSSGGGIFVNGGSEAYINNSTFQDNRACRGGGVWAGNTEGLSIVNSTFSANIAGNRGGGLFLTGNESVNLNFNTFTLNKAAVYTGATSEGKYGGGIVFASFTGGLLAVGNLVVGNIADRPYVGDFGDDCYKSGSAFQYSDYFNNIIGKIGNCNDLGSAGQWGIGSKSAPVTVNLDPLQPNGAKSGYNIPTHKPFYYSLAMNGFDFNSGRGNYPDYCAYTDQRNYLRPNYPNRCDVGAVELDGN
jgi:hypothetical protein